MGGGRMFHTSICACCVSTADRERCANLRWLGLCCTCVDPCHFVVHCVDADEKNECTQQNNT